ncbi:short-chain dehydrogenase TIC 32, chloroplastic [Phialemonium atrogriseum]|uniref:Short-chain dehydrogenase TIC 32, chloroplastic n=1 Tax=Phialemonium atrogriseum TaxID=1093897 RepID=A0AAJ0BWK0_9PEZI|nr:oxidoreductase [Phialemonium atrogriseum]KAK1763401.1 short-chain dehydrogenase TIC 32, chloroplastic [Phialemonium atrogriseum]
MCQTLTGKVILITGGTAGVGAGTTIGPPRHKPAHLLFTGRNPKTAESTISAAAPTELCISVVECDLADLASVKTAADKVLSDLDRLDVLVCNAGIKLLHGRLGRRHRDVRVVMVTSTAWRGTRPGGIVFEKIRTAQEMAIAKRHPKITPGVVATGLVTDLGFVDRALIYIPNIGKVKTAEGTHNLLWSITAPKESIKRGVFYEPVGLSPMETKASKDPELGKKLWDWTKTELKKWMY